MKRILDFMMNNKYFIIVFAVVALSLKLLLDNYDMPDKYLPFLAILKIAFLVVLIAATVHVLSFFAFALVTKNKPEHWWKNLETTHKETGKVNLLKTYIQVLIVSIPLAVYGTLIYLAVFQSWKSILIFAIAFAISRITYYFQNRKRQRLQRDI